MYANVLFRSRLEARWAAFFDLIGWNWEYEPIDLEGWTPDFRVTFSCSNSECNGSHTLLIEVKPYYSIREFAGHPSSDYSFGFNPQNGKSIPADSSGVFGNNPDVTCWEMEHGVGACSYNIGDWAGVEFVNEQWKIAGNIVRYNPDFKSKEPKKPIIIPAKRVHS